MTESPQPRRRSKSALLAESLVIVLSILIAFWVDATWDVITARGRTQAHLEAIRLEFEDNLRITEDGSAACAQVLGVNQHVVALMGPNPPSIPADSLIRLINGSFTAVPVMFRTAALETMISAGEFSEIESVDLQRSLNSWLSGPVFDRQRMGRRYQNVYDQVVEHLVEVMPWGDVVAQNWADEAFPPSGFPMNVRALLSDPKTEGRFAQLWQTRSWFCGREAQDQQTVNDLLDQLAEELGRGSV